MSQPPPVARHSLRRLLPWHWPWPMPAVLAWALAWGLFSGLLGVPDSSVGVALGGACAVGVVLSLWGGTWWRRVLIAGGFPLSLVLSYPGLGANTLPAWAWLLPLGLLLLVYPINAWRDAPVFPTPHNALAELARHAPLPDGARVLDAGCGLGQGLQALRQAYPHAQWFGLEWSWPLRWLCAMRCPWAQVRRGDIWKADWARYDLVYLFQRPESMPRAADKALAQLRPGAWLVSLEFEATRFTPAATYRAPGGKMVWIYRAPFMVLPGETA